MRHIFSILFFVVVAAAAQAQGNLQFNQVKYIEWGMTLTPNVSYPYVDQAITVPAGKVWKIESATGVYTNNTNNNPIYSTNVTILLNGKPIFYTLSGNFHLAGVFPIWLPAGNYTLRVAYATSTSYSGNTIGASVSAIEFNVIP